MATSELQDELRPGPEARRERQRQEARRAILETTEALILASDDGDFSIRALAQRCGYSAPTIYHYFGDKDGLIDALLEERFASLLEDLQRVEIAADPRRNLHALAHGLVEFGVAHPAFQQLLSSTSRNGESRRPPSLENLRELLHEPIGALAADGRLQIPADVAAAALWALVQGLATVRIKWPAPARPAELTAEAIDALLRGLVTEQAR